MVRTTTRAKFTFRVTYFKATGKLYGAEHVKYVVATNEDGGPYMPDVKSKVIGLRDQGGQGALPGLSGEGWGGYILVDCDEGYPALILPRES